MNSQPLVSIVIISFNQERFIAETLNSAAGQSYPNLELIISDDASRDRTWEIVQNWRTKNAARFARVECLRSEVNQGITVNLRRGLDSAHGEFIKLIAGDDLLEDTCIETFMSHAKASDHCIWFGRMQLMDERGNTLDDREQIPVARDVAKFSLSSEEQLKYLKIRNWAPAPASFFSKRVEDEFQLFRRGYRLVEDWPTWVEATKQGCALRLIPETVVRYRQHSESTFGAISFFRRIGYQIGVLRTYADLGWPSVLYNVLLTMAEKIKKRLILRT